MSTQALIAKLKIARVVIAPARSVPVLVVIFLGLPVAWGQAPPSTSSFSLIKDAAQQIAAGNLERAESELQLVLATNPGEYRALNFLGIVRAQQHREGEAQRLFKQVIERKPDFASAHVNLGLLYVQTSRADDAVPQFQEALRLDPARTDARNALLGVWRGQARAALNTQDYEKALSLLIEARKVAPEDPDVLFEFGMIALRMSLFPDAVQAFQEALTKRKDEPAAIYGLGRAQIGLARFQDARATFERYLQLRPDDASAHYALGFALQALLQGPEARLHLEQSIALQPVQTEAYLQLGLLDLDENNLDGAGSRFHRVLERDPKHSGALTGMGRVAFQRKDYQNAAVFLERAIASNSSERQAHYYLGMTYSRLDRKADSERELQVASQLEHAEVEKHQKVLRLLDPGASAIGSDQRK